jgi:hypothetical protein
VGTCSALCGHGYTRMLSHGEQVTCGARTKRWPLASTIQRVRQRLERGDPLNTVDLEYVAVFFGIAAPLPVPAGLTRGQASMIAARARRGKAWTNKPVSAATLANLKRATKKSTCRRGHRFTAENTYHSKHGWRGCKACSRLKYGRKVWRGLMAKKIERARQAMLNAHPDRGGTSAKFREARLRWLTLKRAA